MKKSLFAGVAATLIAGAAAAQERPAGFEMMPCDAGAFVPVLTDAGEIAYWTNPTCPSSAGGREYGAEQSGGGEEGGGVDIFEDLLGS